MSTGAQVETRLQNVPRYIIDLSGLPKNLPEWQKNEIQLLDLPDPIYRPLMRYRTEEGNLLTIKMLTEMSDGDLMGIPSIKEKRIETIREQLSKFHEYLRNFSYPTITSVTISASRWLGYEK